MIDVATTKPPAFDVVVDPQLEPVLPRSARKAAVRGRDQKPARFSSTDEGTTGYVVDGEAEAVHALGRLSNLDRRLVRTQFDRRFTAGRMAAEYVRLYSGLAATERKALEPVPVG
jgi:hypothetical protein